MAFDSQALGDQIGGLLCNSVRGDLIMRADWARHDTHIDDSQPFDALYLKIIVHDLTHGAAAGGMEPRGGTVLDTSVNALVCALRCQRWVTVWSELAVHDLLAFG